MIGLDLAKNVSQIHGIDAAGKVVLQRQLPRRQMEKFFAGLPPTVGAHHWARMFHKFGHEVRMMPPACGTEAASRLSSAASAAGRRR